MNEPSKRVIFVSLYHKIPYIYPPLSFFFLKRNEVVSFEGGGCTSMLFASYSFPILNVSREWLGLEENV